MFNVLADNARPIKLEADHVIIGAGQAGRRAAEALRQAEKSATILIVGEEKFLPYDRPALSKNVLLNDHGENSLFSPNIDFYTSNSIDLYLGATVTEIDRLTKQIILLDGQRIQYGKLLIATGSRPKKLFCPIQEGASVHYLRTIEDARFLRRAIAEKKSIAILGGGFIGLEVAASAVAQGCIVTVIEPNQHLMQRSIPSVVSSSIQKFHKIQGVRFVMGEIPTGVTYSDGKCVVETENNRIKADLVLAGVGAQPNVELAISAGLHVDNGIVVDAYCRTDDPHIYAAGDVTSHFNPLLGRHVRIEAWQVAENQPAIAAANMAGGELTYSEIPWLWSDQYEWNIQTLGMFNTTQTLVVRGNPETVTFSVYGVGENNLIEAFASVNCGRDVAVVRRIMARSISVDRAALADLSVPLPSLLK
jgi:anthranilate 1,2-dioxygenase ferredoxin reductase subunit